MTGRFTVLSITAIFGQSVITFALSATALAWVGRMPPA